MADDDEEWRFSIDEVGDDGSGDTDGNDGDDGWGATIGEDDDGPTVTVGDAETTEESDGEGGNVAGTLVPRTPIETGTPTLENAAFVTAGVLLTVLVIGNLLWADPVVLGGIAFAVLATSTCLYLFFTRL